MIRLNFSAAVSLYVFLSILGLLLAWIFFERSKPIKHFSFTEQHLWRCEICTTPYVDSLNDALSRCPQCGSLNRREAS